MFSPASIKATDLLPSTRFGMHELILAQYLHLCVISLPSDKPVVFFFVKVSRIVSWPHNFFEILDDRVGRELSLRINNSRHRHLNSLSRILKAVTE